MCYFLNGVFKPLLIPKYYLCLIIFIRAVKTYQFPPGVKTIQDTVFPDAYSYTLYPDSQGGGLFGKKNK